MKAIEELHNAFISNKLGFEDLKECVKWAEERLLNNEEQGDTDIMLLAGSTDVDEIKDIAQKIIFRYSNLLSMNEEVWAGKYLLQLYQNYKASSMSITDLEPIIDRLYQGLNYPDWLVMLSRNCEYAIDIDSFIKPFEDEFTYICDLWKESMTLENFMRKYDRRISNTHDIQM